MTKSEAGAARKTAMPAKSSGTPHRAAGVRFSTDPKKPLPFIAPPAGRITQEEQVQNLSLLGKLNHYIGWQ